MKPENASEAQLKIVRVQNSTAIILAIIGAVVSIAVAWFASRSVAVPAAKVALEEQRSIKPNEVKEKLPVPSAPNTQAAGWAALGPDQIIICWGQNPLLPKGPANHVRSFSFQFPRAFKAVPSVTNGINVVGSGYTFAVFRASVTETEYTGFLVENNGRKTDVPVSMSYTAIGEPK